MQPIPAVIDGNTASALGIEAHGSRLRVVSDRKRIAKRRVASTAKLTGGLFLYVIDFAWVSIGRTRIGKLMGSWRRQLLGRHALDL